MGEQQTRPGNVMEGDAERVIQTGTIVLPPPRRTRRWWPHVGWLVACVAIALGVTRPWEQSASVPTEGGAVAADATSTTSSTVATTIAPIRCTSGTHVLNLGFNTTCEVDNPAVSPAHAAYTWPDGRTTVMVIGKGYKTLFATDGEPFSRLGNGFADADGDGVTFHRTEPASGYFKIGGEGGRGYCADFWVDTDDPGSPVRHRGWEPCRSDQ